MQRTSAWTTTEKLGRSTASRLPRPRDVWSRRRGTRHDDHRLALEIITPTEFYLREDSSGQFAIADELVSDGLKYLPISHG